MIRQISVNGFRTLSEFKLSLNPGLNILVGPNGGGKTTIILFFSFLNDLYTLGLSSAISNVGGAGNIFRKIGQRGFEDVISATVIGSIKLDDEARIRPAKNANKENNNYLYYQYSFEIRLSDDREDVFFQTQELLLRRASKDMAKPSLISKWDLKFNKGFDLDGEVSSKVEILSEQATTIFELSEHRTHSRKQNTLFGVKETSIIDELVDEDDCLLNISRMLDVTSRIAINQEFGRGLLYNPQPEQIRKPEDSAKTPGIRSDGSGLYATLLAIKRRRRTLVRGRVVKRDVPFSRNVQFSRVVDYFKFAFPALHTVDVVNDPFDNQIRARVTLDEKDGIQLPLASLSDGTLKWMSLATALLTTRHVIGIEEPENFLHPAVQQQALELIREQTRENSFVLVSTHSQSILDAANPEELIFITLEASKTVASRVKNPEHIKKLIYENGFALSFYYMSGALQNA